MTSDDDRSEPDGARPRSIRPVFGRDSGARPAPRRARVDGGPPGASSVRTADAVPAGDDASISRRSNSRLHSLSSSAHWPTARLRCRRGPKSWTRRSDACREHQPACPVAPWSVVVRDDEDCSGPATSTSGRRSTRSRDSNESVLLDDAELAENLDPRQARAQGPRPRRGITAELRSRGIDAGVDRDGHGRHRRRRRAGSRRRVGSQARLVSFAVSTARRPSASQRLPDAHGVSVRGRATCRREGSASWRRDPRWRPLRVSHARAGWSAVSSYTEGLVAGHTAPHDDVTPIERSVAAGRHRSPPRVRQRRAPTRCAPSGAR